MQSNVDQNIKIRRLQIVAIVLAALLVMSVVALVVVLNNRGGRSNVSKSTDNVLEPLETEAEVFVGNASYPRFETLASKTEGEDIKLTFWDRDEQKEFVVKNMLPGDKESKSYTVTVKYKNAKAIYMGVTVLPESGNYKLSQVLKMKVEVIYDNEVKVTYDGLMTDLGPKGNNVGLDLTGLDKDAEITYKLTVYLDTSVNNNYQGKTLTAEFSWWVNRQEIPTETETETETETQAPPPPPPPPVTTEETTEEITETTEVTTEEPTETTEETTEEPTETTEVTTEEPTETTEETTEEITETTEETTQETTETETETVTETETETETNPPDGYVCPKPKTCMWPWLHDVGVKYPACHALPWIIPGATAVILAAGWIFVTAVTKKTKTGGGSDAK